jgi:HEAT repeat protein
MRCFVALLVVALVLGCGGSPPEKKVAKTKGAKKAPAVKKEQPPPPPPPKVDPKAFPSIPAALESLGQAAEAADQDGITKADQWLAMQGAAAVGPLGDVLKNESAPLPQRIAVSRTLISLPGAKEPLLAALDSKEKLVRANVIQSLGRIKPVDKQLVTKCMELARSDDEETQRYAVSALGKMGPAAKDAVPMVQDMLNDKKYNETVRAEARKTLKAIEPRKGLMTISGENGK